MATGTNNTGTKPIDLELVFKAISTGSPIDMNELLGIDNKKPVRVPVMFEASDTVHTKIYEQSIVNRERQNALLATANSLSERGYEILKDSEFLEGKRVATLRKFADIEREMYNEDGSLKEGFTEADVKAYNKAKDAAIKAINTEIVKQNDDTKKWIKGLTDLSLEQLNETLEAAKRNLALLKAVPIIDPAQIAEAEFLISTLSEQIKTKTTENQTNLKHWITTFQKDMAACLTAVGSCFVELSDASSKACFESIGHWFTLASDVGSLVYSSIDTYKKVFDTTAKGAEVAGESTKKSLTAAEKGSAILTILLTAIQLAQRIFALFSNEEEKKFNENLAETNRQLEKTRINALMAAEATKTIFGDDVWGKAIGGIDAANEALKRYNDTGDKLIKRKNSESKAKGWFSALLPEKDPIDNVEDGIRNMRLTIRKGNWFRSGKYTTIGEKGIDLFDENGKLDSDALKSFVGSETFKQLDKKDRDALTQLNEDAELYKTAMKGVSEYLKSIFGKLGETMTDALVSSFQKGTDSAKEFNKTVSGMLEEMAKDMMYSTLLQPLFDDADEKMKTIMANDALTDEEKFAEIARIMKGLGGGVNGIKDQANQFLDSIQKGAADAGFNIFAQSVDSRQGAEGQAIAQASQDSVDRMNGTLTSIQGHTDQLVDNTTSLMENTKLLVLYSSDSLRYLQGIRDNTNHLSAMRNDISLMQTTLYDMNRVGIKLLNPS